MTSELSNPDKSLTGSAEHRGMDFSLFYFASDDTAHGQGYRLLIEGAKFADQHGFTAVWTPERHFHAFGGLYPNPAITSAAVAAVTERVQIRAGSVVLPLHSPIRVAEEWAMIDNLSNGRVGISVASGWHADDFVFAPANYEDRREIMMNQIEIIRQLWRGESVTFKGGAGNDVNVKIMPRPVQADLPIWLTAFGSPETFRGAGEIGASILTHMLGKSVELLADKIEIYRTAWQKAGHNGRGHVTLMLHTFVGEDDDVVRETVRAPFSNYLRSSLDLMTTPARGAGLGVSEHITDQNLDALVEYSFNRYYESCALLGTPDTCQKMVDRLKKADVDEIGCLIDFGVDSDSVLSSLDQLVLVKEAANAAATPAEARAASHNPTLSLDETRARVEMRKALSRRRQTDRTSKAPR